MLCNQWLFRKFLFREKEDSLPQIWAALPTNQWAQLNSDLRGAPGWGLRAAMKG